MKLYETCYSLDPYVHQLSDEEILGESVGADAESFVISDTWYGMYKRIKLDNSSAVVNRIKKDVANIVKRNAKANVVELNKKVMELIRMDEDFKKDILASVLGEGLLCSMYDSNKIHTFEQDTLYS
jgi:hypothetical protein